MKLSDSELAFLADQHSAAMVTVAPDGIAKVARVGVALVDGKLWSSGTADRIRTRRLRRDPRCTLYVHDQAFAFLALEQSPDMVPGMLYSRLRPGVNHIAFTLESASALDDIVAKASDHGWSPLPTDRHPIAGGARVAYLEDADGFEVELVAPGG